MIINKRLYKELERCSAQLNIPVIELAEAAIITYLSILTLSAEEDQKIADIITGSHFLKRKK